MKRLTDEEILDYLMTSEFNEGLTPDEFKFLLSKFRNFFRIVSGKNDTLKVLIESSKKELQDLKYKTDNQLRTAEEQKNKAIEKYNNLKQKKLTLKERFLGKIIIQNESE